MTSAQTAASGLAVTRVECEDRVDPLAIDVPRPRLSWVLGSGQQGQRQTAYQILAASRPELLGEGRADLWDSGRIASSDSRNIEYGGKALRSNQQCFWMVRAWDGAGVPSAWSQAASWTSGILETSAWKAQWITFPGGALVSGPLPCFRKEVEIGAMPRRALVHISGLGAHELSINGRRVGDHVLSPAWSDYRKRVYYETFDVTPLLHEGKNAIAVMLGNGMYNVPGGRYAKFTASFGPPKLLLQMHVEFDAAPELVITSNGTWRTARGPVTFSCIYGGEDYDARSEFRGWDQPGFDDSGWIAARGQEAPGGVLQAQTSPPLKVTERFRSVKVTQPKKGIAVYDLGQNFSGWPALRARGAAGDSVLLTTGELLTAEGLVSQRSSGSPVSFKYTIKGQGVEEWRPRFTYTGFRYVQVETTGSPVVEEITGEFIHSAAPRIGSLTTSNELFNRTLKLIDAAVRSNMSHVFTDCPHREKLGWLEQTHLMGNSLLYRYDLRTVLPKIARDMQDAQLVSGLVPDIAPEYVVFGGGFRDSPEWGSAAVLVPWLAYQWYGDVRTLRESYPMMKRYLEYLSTKAQHGILSHGLGDWYDIGPGGPGASKLTPKGLTATAFYFLDADILGRTAGVLGLPGEQAAFAQCAAAIRAAFNQRFFDASQVRYATGSQTANALPLVLGMAPETARAQLVSRIVDDVRSRGNHVSAGDVGYRYLLLALARNGRSDVIFDMASRTDPPSYGAQLAMGATALTEAWDADPNSSQNHFMLGHIQEWFYGYLAGIRLDPDVPGFRRAIIQPNPVGDVNEVRAALDTPFGRVECDWRRTPSSFTLRVRIPTGMTARVHTPDPIEVSSGTYEWKR